MTDRLREYIQEVYRARNKAGCIPRYEERHLGSEAWRSGWYQGMLTEALELIPDAVLSGWMDEPDADGG